MNMNTQLWSGSMKFTQTGDNMSDYEQWLDVSTEDGGAGKYFVIRTERWAFDTIEELVGLLERVKKALEVEE